MDDEAREVDAFEAVIVVEVYDYGVQKLVVQGVEEVEKTLYQKSVSSLRIDAIKRKISPAYVSVISLLT